MKNAYVTSKGLNLHSAPGASASIIDILAESDKIHVLREARHPWLYVYVPKSNKYGYLSSHFVAYEAEVPTVEVPEKVPEKEVEVTKEISVEIDETPSTGAQFVMGVIAVITIIIGAIIYFKNRLPL